MSVCGICGVWNYADAAPVDRGLVARMVAALRHRGPDDDGTHFDDAAGLALGFRRLAVVDLTPAARQPMCNEDGSLWLVANGEIYNAPALRTAFIAGGHRFRSRSDSEVILHAYEDRGTECVAAHPTTPVRTFRSAPPHTPFRGPHKRAGSPRCRSASGSGGRRR